MDYSTRFRELNASIEWRIALPKSMSDFFEQRGYVAPFEGDERRYPRAHMPTRGVMLFSESLPFLQRDMESAIGVFTANISRGGMGFVSPIQLFPEERVRILLPTCWFDLRIAHCRRIAENAYRIGCHLLSKNDPSLDALTQPHAIG